MKTIKILTTILIILIVGSLIWAAFLPSSIHIKHSIKIKAPIGVVYNEINDLHNWNNWSLWKDTSLSPVFEGAPKGVGAKVIWTDKKEGKATLSIVEADHFSFIKTQMTVPEREDIAEMNFTFETIGDSVKVTWTRDINKLNYPFGRFVGWMLKKGYDHNFKLALNSLKEYIETKKQNPNYYGYDIVKTTFPGGDFLASNASATMEQMPSKIAESFSLITKFATDKNLQILGAPMVQWHSYNPEAESSFTCMIPTQLDSVVATKKVFTLSLPKTNVVMVKYTGPYEGSYNAWVALDTYVIWNALIMNGDPWEEYVTDPGSEPDSTKWVTNIYFPVK